jgi:hypothetical protein
MSAHLCYDQIIMGTTFRRPPAIDPPRTASESDDADYVPPGESGSALASVKRIAQAIPHRKVQRKAESDAGGKDDEEKGVETSEPGDAAEQEADAVSEKVAGDLDSGDEAKEGGEAKEEAPKIAAKLEGVGLKVFLANDGPPKLTGGGRKKLGNLVDMQTMTVADAIKARGGGAGQARLAGPWAQKSLAETANAAAAGDETAETAIKMVKQASAKAGDHGGRSG